MSDRSPTRSFWNDPALDAAWFAVAVTSVVATWLFDFVYTNTHHRPLGAATLAVAVLVTFCGLFVLALRFGVGPRLARSSLGVAALVLVAIAMT